MEAERRPVIVLFADMIGFPAFTERSGSKPVRKLAQGGAVCGSHLLERIDALLSDLSRGTGPSRTFRRRLAAIGHGASK
jgi:hypothetical protein